MCVVCGCICGKLQAGTGVQRAPPTASAAFLAPAPVPVPAPGLMVRALAIPSLRPASHATLQVDWKDPANVPATPRMLGTKAYVDFPIEEVLPYIDWNPFFQVGGVCILRDPAWWRHAVRLD